MKTARFYSRAKYRYGQCSKCSRVSGAFLAQLAQFVQGTGFHSEVPLQAKTSIVERYQRYNKAKAHVPEHVNESHWSPLNSAPRAVELRQASAKVRHDWSVKATYLPTKYQY